jgi:hypothetical protein
MEADNVIPSDDGYRFRVYFPRHHRPEKERKSIMKLNSNVYDVLKSVAQIWLPGAGTLYFTLAQIWGLPAAEEVTGTVIAVDTFLGVLLGLSTAKFNASADRYDGVLSVVDGEDTSTLHLKNVDPRALETKDEIVFRVEKTPSQ